MSHKHCGSWFFKGFCAHSDSQNSLTFHNEQGQKWGNGVILLPEGIILSPEEEKSKKRIKNKDDAQEIATIADALKKKIEDAKKSGKELKGST